MSHRYALALATGIALREATLALHECDNPLLGGFQRVPARAGRGGGWPPVRRGNAGLAARRARAVALREAVRHGWDADTVARALLGAHDPTLW
jgi:hypothetical protein